ncbi:hypothetical protein, partial [Microbacterium sp.]|uniref:hypothetical protein n=1 Tax=Microbacterium sp. TaxID=51671 RepID=UPI003A8E82CF
RAASSTMTKKNIIADIHKLIQRNSQPIKRPDEDNLAFDKCTLLSSQGSDTPTVPTGKTSHRCRATSQS